MAATSARTERRLAEALAARHPDEAARRFETADAEEIVEFLGPLPADHAVATLSGLTPDRAARLFAAAPESMASRWISSWNPNRAAAALARLDESERDRVLGALDAAHAEEMRGLMAYPPDTAGSLMDPRVTTFRPDATVRDVVRRLRLFRRRRVQDVFLVESDGRLVGLVPLEAVVLAEPDERLVALARVPAPSIQATAPRDAVIEEMAGHAASSLAVVDYEGRILGVLRQEELVSAAQQEATADLAKMVGASAEERALSSPFFSVRKRLPWLQINLLTAFLAASVVGLFEGTIARFTALAVLLPVVAGQSGNTGSQALAVTMRGLALREVRVRHWWKVASKEMLAGSINGLAVAATTSLAVWFWSGSAGLAAVIAISMVISMTLAGLSGACIPMILTVLRQDPAQSSSIILTTVTDVVGFFSFLGIATAMSGLL
ncbi:MAG: magnesium transporter [Myxococcota bacterium]